MLARGAAMFFFFSKVLPGLLFPYPLFLILSAIVLWKMKTGRLRRVFGAVLLTVTISSTYVTAAFLMRGLENRYAPLTVEETPAAEAIVVLSGMVTPLTRAKGRPEFSAAVDRILAGRELLTARKAPVLIISGGSGLISQIGTPEAETLRNWMIKDGFAPERVIAENASRNTAENAAETAKIARARGIRKIILVTSAFHMQRSVLCFEKEGFEITPYPVDYYILDEFPGIEAFFPAPAGMTLSGIALKEYAGIIAYRLKGYL